MTGGQIQLQQPWRCELCKTAGEVSFAAHEDVSTIATRVEQAHREADPGCSARYGRRGIRVGGVHHADPC